MEDMGHFNTDYVSFFLLQVPLESKNFSFLLEPRRAKGRTVLGLPCVIHDSQSS